MEPFCCEQQQHRSKILMGEVSLEQDTDTKEDPRYSH